MESLRNKKFINDKVIFKSIYMQNNYYNYTTFLKILAHFTYFEKFEPKLKFIEIIYTQTNICATSIYVT